MKGEKRWKQFEGQQGVYSSEFGDKAEVGWNSGATTLLELVFLGIQKKHRQLELDASCCSVQVAKDLSQNWLKDDIVIKENSPNRSSQNLRER